jgi:predicted  nucleic acid-binding Zn-ribbon protein
MAVDPKIDEIKQQLDQVAANDATEDLAYEQQIADLQAQVIAANAAKDAALESLVPVMAERDRLLEEKAATIADLVAVRDSLQAQMNTLDARITALGG